MYDVEQVITEQMNYTEDADDMIDTFYIPVPLTPVPAVSYFMQPVIESVRHST